MTGEKKREYQKQLMRERRAVVRGSEIGSSGDKSSGVVENEERANESKDVERTACDALFDMKKPGYYIFEKEIQVNKDGSPRVCWYCKTRFDTRLSMNKFCCPEHKEAWLVASLRRGE